MDDFGKTPLDMIPPEHLRITLNQRPYKQSQTSEWTIEGAVYSDNDLFICYGGEAEFRLNGEYYSLKAGSALLVRPGEEVFARLKSKENFDAIAQHFSVKLFNRIDLLELFEFSRLVTFENWDYIRSNILFYEKLESAGVKRLVAHSLFAGIFSEYLHTAYLAPKSLEDRKTASVLKMVEELDKDITAPGIAASVVNKAAYSNDYAVQLFKEYLNQTPKQYVIRGRLRVGKEYLSQGYSVKKAAVESGFRDELYFSRLFKKYEGISPSEFKGQQGVQHI